MEAHVSLRVRRTLVLAAIGVAATLLFAISSQRADAKAKQHSAVVKGPKGLKFYKPPKNIPGRHGTLIWARKASGVVALQDARYTKLVLYSSRTPQGAKDAISGLDQRPQGQAAEGRLAGDHLGARNDRRRGRLRALSRHPGRSGGHR